MITEQVHAGHPHIQFDERKVVPATMSRCGSILNKIKTSVFAVLACFAASLAFGETAANNASPEDREAILDMIAQINHINWILCTIKSYNNIVVLEEEYEKISPGNLWLDRISNNETAERLKRMLKTLHSLSKNDRQMRRWREDFKEHRERERKTYFLKASKQAVDTLMGQAQDCCSLWSWASNPAGSIAAVAHTAFNMAHYSASLYNDYDNFVYELDKTAKDRQFDFDTTKLDILHQQNIELLQDQWEFIHRYRLDDRLRVSDTNIKILLNCLKDDNHSRIYTRLMPMREHFSLFPEYWYYLSCVAMETGHFKEGIEACDTFFHVNRGIFRDDPMEGTVAFNKAFMLPKTEANKGEIRRCLELAWKNNILRGDWQLEYLVAIMFKGVFNEKEKAVDMLEHAIALIEQESRDRIRYGNKAGVTIDEGLRNCRNALHELRGEPLEEENEMESSLIRTQNIVIEDGNDSLDITGITNNLVSFSLPNDEHIHDLSKYTLQMFKRGTGVASVNAITADSRVNTNGCIMLSFNTPSVPSRSNIDEYRLTFNNPKCTVIWTFRSMGYYFTDAEINNLGEEMLECMKSKNLWYRFCIWAAVDEDKFLNYFKSEFLTNLSSSVAPRSVSINGKEFHYPLSLDSLLQSTESDDDEDFVEFKRRLYAELNGNGKRYVELEKGMPKLKKIFKDAFLEQMKKEIAK